MRNNRQNTDVYLRACVGTNRNQNLPSDAFFIIASSSWAPFSVSASRDRVSCNRLTTSKSDAFCALMSSWIATICWCCRWCSSTVKWIWSFLHITATWRKQLVETTYVTFLNSLLQFRIYGHNLLGDGLWVAFHWQVVWIDQTIYRYKVLPHKRRVFW